MEWWDGDLQQVLEESATNDDNDNNNNGSNINNSNNKSTDVDEGGSVPSGLDLTLALPEDETAVLVSIPPRKRTKYYHQHHHHNEYAVAAHHSPPLMETNNQGLNHRRHHQHQHHHHHHQQQRSKNTNEKPEKSQTQASSSFLETANKARGQFNYAVSEQAKAEKALLDAQLVLDSAKLRLSQTQETVKRTRQQVFLSVIQQDQTWYECYRLLKLFKAKHGHTVVPRAPKKEMKELDPTLPKLSKWVGVNRRDYRKGILDEFKVFALDQVEFDWDPGATQWTRKYELLVEFKRKNGHSKVKYNLQKDDPDDGGLGAWVKRQVGPIFSGSDLGASMLISNSHQFFVWFLSLSLSLSPPPPSFTNPLCHSNISINCSTKENPLN